MKVKKQINWYFFLAGIIILFLNISRFQTINESQFKKLNVHLSKDVLVKANRLSASLFFTELRNQFEIYSGSISYENRKIIVNLKKDQAVTIYITKEDYANLKTKKQNIQIVGLKIAGVHYIKPSPDFFDLEAKEYEIRLFVFNIFLLFMLFINSFLLIPRKINIAFVTIFIGIVIFMRVFDFGIY